MVHDLDSLELNQSWVEEESMSGLDTGNLLEDAKFYQDVAVELQTAYDNLQDRYVQQAHLIEEASGALHAAETQASKRQWELLNVKKTTKLMSNWLLAKWFLSTGSSLQWPKGL